MKTKEKRFIKLDFLDASNYNNRESALFELKDSDDINNAHNMIFLIKGQEKNQNQPERKDDFGTPNSNTGLVLETESSSDVEDVMEQKTYCDKCGNECEIENKFCSNCGTRIADIVNEDQEEDDSEVKGSGKVTILKKKKHSLETRGKSLSRELNTGVKVGK